MRSPMIRTKSRTDIIRGNVSRFDRTLTFAVLALSVLGTLLVWAATSHWFKAQGLDPQYYLKRHIKIGRAHV